MQLISHGGGDDGIIDFSWARGLPQKPRHKAQDAADDDVYDAFSAFPTIFAKVTHTWQDSRYFLQQTHRATPRRRLRRPGPLQGYADHAPPS